MKKQARTDISPARRAVDGRSVDDIDRRLLLALTRDGRRPATDLAKDLGLSRQAVTERIRDLERQGVIRGYRAEVDPAALGLKVRAFIHLNTNGTQGPRQEREILKHLKAHPQVRSVHRVSGEDCFVVQMLCRGLEDVSLLLAELQGTRALYSSRTAFVLETVLDKTGLGPLEPALLSPGA